MEKDDLRLRQIAPRRNLFAGEKSISEIASSLQRIIATCSKASLSSPAPERAPEVPRHRQLEDGNSSMPVSIATSMHNLVGLRNREGYSASKSEISS